MLIPFGQELAGCFNVGMSILGAVLGLAGCVFSWLRSVQVMDWFVPVSPLALLHGSHQKWMASVVLGCSLLLFTIFPLQVLFLALS